MHECNGREIVIYKYKLTSSAMYSTEYRNIKKSWFFVMKIISRFLFMFLLFIDCSAENNNTYSYIDDAHKEVSQTILDSSGYIDRSLSNWIGDVKSFVYQEENDQKSSLDKDVNAVDSFFKNEKFMDDTDKSFIRIRATSHIQSLGKDQNDVGVKARLSLNKTKKNIRLFIEKDDEEKKY